jgi:hypothetical protein
VQANQVREKPPKRSNRSTQRNIPVSETSRSRCPHCSALIQDEDLICKSCGRLLIPGSTGLSGLKETLLFGAILLLISLAVTPVWPGEQIYGKSIQFLVHHGVSLPGNAGEAALFRQQMMNVVQLYQGINLLHYVTVSAFILLFGIHLIRMRKQLAGHGNTVWVVLGLLLLVFPIVNLVISWSMFLSPGVLGSSVAAIIVLIAGGFLK